MNIKKVIKAHGWTIQRLADALGKKQPSVSSIVNGNPKLSNLQEIAEIMGISVSELLADKEESVGVVCPHCGKPIKVKLET